MGAARGGRILQRLGRLKPDALRGAPSSRAKSSPLPWAGPVALGRGGAPGPVASRTSMRSR